MKTPSLNLNGWSTLVAAEGAILGVDNGLRGAIAALRTNGQLLAVIDMPVICDGPKGRRAICLPLLSEIYVRSHGAHVYIEGGGVRPGESPLSAFTQGRGVGASLGIAAALSIPVTTLAPAKWKRIVGIPSGANKDASRAECIRRWPAHAASFARKSEDGRADAALIGLTGIILSKSWSPKSRRGSIARDAWKVGERKMAKQMKTEPLPAVPDEALKALVTSVDAPDRDLTRTVPVSLLQHNSVAKLMDHPEARPGDLLVPHADDAIVVKGATGFIFVPVAFNYVYIEWALEPGGAPLAVHVTKPRGTEWLKADKSPIGKEGGFLKGPDGEYVRMEGTLLCQVLVCQDDSPFVATLAFKSTSSKKGFAFEKAANRTKSADGTLKGVVTGLWRITSLFDGQSGSNKWFTPNLTLLGTLGQSTGPSPIQVRLAAELRRDFLASVGKLQAPDDGPPVPPATAVVDRSREPNDSLPY